MNVLGGHVPQVDLIDAGAVLHIVSHMGRGNDEIHRQRRVCGQLDGIPRLPRQPPPGSGLPTDGIDLLDPLHRLKETGAPRDPVAFQGRSHRQTDGLLGSCGIRHHKIGGHGIQPPLHAFHRREKGLEVDGNIGFSDFGHGCSSRKRSFLLLYHIRNNIAIGF